MTTLPIQNEKNGLFFYFQQGLGEAWQELIPIENKHYWRRVGLKLIGCGMATGRALEETPYILKTSLQLSKRCCVEGQLSIKEGPTAKEIS